MGTGGQRPVRPKLAARKWLGNERRVLEKMRKPGISGWRTFQKVCGWIRGLSGAGSLAGRVNQALAVEDCGIEGI